VPSFGEAFQVHWLDAAAWTGMGLLWLAAFSLSLRRATPALRPLSVKGTP
jgi:hypothetical protein